MPATSAMPWYEPRYEQRIKVVMRKVKEKSSCLSAFLWYGAVCQGEVGVRKLIFSSLFVRLHKDC